MSEMKFPKDLGSILREYSAILNAPKEKPLPIREHMEKTEQYQAMSLQILESINQNTANLYTIVELINKSSEQQDEIVSLLVEILSISKAQTKKEASNWYRKSMDRINKMLQLADPVT